VVPDQSAHSRIEGVCRGRLCLDRGSQIKGRKSAAEGCLLGCTLDIHVLPSGTERMRRGQRIVG
jgi:hypothetical protein